jgi:Zn-dependent protease/predicted transcriptional regulator
VWKTLTIGTVAGIPLKIHWTFGLLVLFLAYTTISAGLDTKEALGFSAYVIVLFGCVVLHELGHALSAKYYGVQTRDIILSPIGGVARLEKLPEKPFQEFVIAIAGPLVNLAIAVALIIFILTFGSTGLLPVDDEFVSVNTLIEFGKYVLIMNLALFTFNLVPAFPMDGGRILRALLSMYLGRLRATNIATIVGQILAIAFVIMGFYYGHFILGFIGLFIYFSAGVENRQVKIAQQLSELTAADIMRNRYTIVYTWDNYERILELCKQGIENNFLVMNELSQISGSVSENHINEILASGNTMQTVQSFYSPRVGFVTPDTNLRAVYDMMQQNSVSVVAVMDDHRIAGIIDIDSIHRAIDFSSRGLWKRIRNK